MPQSDQRKNKKVIVSIIANRSNTFHSAIILIIKKGKNIQSGLIMQNVVNSLILNFLSFSDYLNAFNIYFFYINKN